MLPWAHALKTPCCSDESVIFIEPTGLSIVANMHDDKHVPGDNQWAILLNAQDEPEVYEQLHWPSKDHNSNIGLTLKASDMCFVCTRSTMAYSGPRRIFGGIAGRAAWRSGTRRSRN